MKTQSNIQTAGNIVFRETLDAWNGGASENSNLVIYVRNVEELYLQFEWLCNCCAKKFRKSGGLDLDYLKNSSTMKSITRAARKYAAQYGEYFTMEEDAAARAALCYDVIDYCEAVCKE